MIDLALSSGGSSIPVVQVVAVVLFLIAVVTAYQSIVIVRAYEKRAYTRFGKFQGLLNPGPNFVLPFVTKTYTFDMRTQTLDVPKQEAITRDNSPVIADAVVYIKVMDAQKAFLEVDNYKRPSRISPRRHCVRCWATWNWTTR
jgi:SPFH domain, Band 7 family protein